MDCIVCLCVLGRECMRFLDKAGSLPAERNCVREGMLPYALLLRCSFALCEVACMIQIARIFVWILICMSIRLAAGYLSASLDQ